MPDGSGAAHDVEVRQLREVVEGLVEVLSKEDKGKIGHALSVRVSGTDWLKHLGLMVCQTIGLSVAATVMWMNQDARITLYHVQDNDRIDSVSKLSEGNTMMIKELKIGNEALIRIESDTKHAEQDRQDMVHRLDKIESQISNIRALPAK